MSPLAEALLWIAICLVSGSIPYSVIIARAVTKSDLSDVGDGNPGATNVIASAGLGWGIVAGLLDGFKAAIPIGIAKFVIGIDGWALVAASIAPLLGHAYSPFLKFKGGKAVASTFGTWCGLTIWEGPTVMGIMLGYWYSSVRVSGWAVLFTMISLLAYFVFAARIDWVMGVVWVLNAALLAWRYREDLQQPPGVHEWVERLARRLRPGKQAAS
ncbi:MAG: hypothetical protein GYB68_07340 [Chloroflexi bacterium]|nr:hypothetical protein [Chloroflexota bacterium]